MEFAAAVAAAQQSRQQQLAFTGCATRERAAHAGRVVGDRLEVAFELVPGDVGRVMILDQNVPFGHRSVHATTNALATVHHAHPARRAPECIGASIDRIGQDVVHDVVGRQSPHDAMRLTPAGFGGQLDPFVSQPDMDLPDTLELGELREDELQWPAARACRDSSRSGRARLSHSRRRHRGPARRGAPLWRRLQTMNAGGQPAFID